MALPEHTAPALDPTDDSVWLRIQCATQPKGTDGITLTWAGVTVHAVSVKVHGHGYRITYSNGRTTDRLTQAMSPGLLAMVR